jgi:bifunctional DNA-binding transcriptional regulator/antitoxin component of YhaV-PrlF toxin-antitoxin module
MTTLTITAKGQVTLRQDLLKHLGVVPGQKIEVDKLPGGRIAVRAAAPKSTMSDFIGCLSQKYQPALTIAEIKEIAAKGWTGKDENHG